MFIANKFNGIKSGDKLIQKLIEPKTRKLLKSQKLFKSKKSKNDKLAKFQKRSKSGNLHKFVIKKVKVCFLTFDTRTAFNYL